MMRERPADLPDRAIIEAVRSAYGIEPSAVAYLPIGNDVYSSVFRLETAEGVSCFLKARQGAGFSERSLAVPFALRQAGVPHVPAPLPTANGGLWTAAGGFSLSLHPFIDGRTATDAGLPLAAWRSLGAAARQVHAFQLPERLVEMVPVERFVPWRRELMERAEEAVMGGGLMDAGAQALAAFWRANRRRIWAVVARCDQLAERLRRRMTAFSLCHADLHSWNLLVEPDGRFWIVDWDEAMLAPKERDLMFVIDGIGAGLVSQAETAAFLDGYGPAEIDQEALTYYRYAWAVQDMAAYAEMVFFSPALGELTRREAVQGFIIQFGPGNMIEIAEQSDQT